jgi:hypothetical protein
MPTPRSLDVISSFTPRPSGTVRPRPDRTQTHPDASSPSVALRGPPW